MAKIHEEIIVVKISKLVKDGHSAEITGEEITATIEAVVQEMVGDGIVVEVTKEQ